MTTITQTITALPTAPARTDDPSVFITRADAMMAALPTMVTQENTWAGQANTVAGEVNSNAATATTQAALATTQVGLATTQATNAAASAVTAVNAPGTNATSTTSLAVSVGSKSLTIQTSKSLVVGMSVKIAYTVTPTTWMFGDITAHDSSTGALTVNVTEVNGSGTQAAWTVSLSGPSGAGGSSVVIRSARTANTILGVADQGALIDITSGSFTQTFTAAATLGDGWYAHIKNSGTGLVVLEPGTVGSEIIVDGGFTAINVGADFCVNGTFATDTDWTKGTGWTITGGQAVGTATSALLTPSAATTIVANKCYKVVYTITRSAGSVSCEVGTTAGITRSSNGTYTDYIMAQNVTNFRFRGSSFTGTIDNVTIQLLTDWVFFSDDPSRYVYPTGGAVSVVNWNSTAMYIGQTIPALTNGADYIAEVTIAGMTTLPTLRFAGMYFELSGGATLDTKDLMYTNDTFRVRFTATGAHTSIKLKTKSSSGIFDAGTIDNVSLKLASASAISRIPLRKDEVVTVSTNGTDFFTSGENTQGNAKAYAVFGIASDIHASYNVSSINDNGTGDATVTLTTSMVHPQYAIAANTLTLNKLFLVCSTQALGSFRLLCWSDTGSATDPEGLYSVAVFGE